MYSTTVDGEVLSFGTSGFLYQSNKLMYDRKTKSLWHQFRGEPVTGELAHSGIVLDVIPVTLTTWGEWLASHPDTTILDAETGVYPGDRYLSESDPGSFYFDYRAQPRHHVSGGHPEQCPVHQGSGAWPLPQWPGKGLFLWKSGRPGAGSQRRTGGHKPGRRYPPVPAEGPAPITVRTSSSPRWCGKLVRTYWLPSPVTGGVWKKTPWFTPPTTPSASPAFPAATPTGSAGTASTPTPKSTARTGPQARLP